MITEPPELSGGTEKRGVMTGPPDSGCYRGALVVKGCNDEAPR